MKLKYIIILLQIILLTSLSGQAQTFGIKGGINMAEIRADLDSQAKKNPGIYAGGALEFPISEAFSFETGIFLATKGVKVKEESDNYEYSVKLNMYYIDIPFLIKTMTPLSEKTKLYVSFGPYLGTGISGKSKMTETYSGTTEKDEEDINFGNDEDEDDLKRFDLGLTIGSGLKFNKFELGIYFDVGSSNLSLYDDDDSIIKNRVLRISGCYYFGK